MKNILKNIKSNPLILGIIGSMIGGLLILFSIPLSRLLLKLLFSWSNMFSQFIIETTIKRAIMDTNIINVYTFLYVFYIFIVLLFSSIFSKFKPNIEKKSRKKMGNILKYTLTIIFLFLLFFASFIYFMDVTRASLNATQKLRMGIVAPYIDDQKEEELWSKWYLIRTKIDYISLNYELDNIAENNNIELPQQYY